MRHGQAGHQLSRRRHAVTGSIGSRRSQRYRLVRPDDAIAPRDVRDAQRGERDDQRYEYEVCHDCS
jgi:hypothetical protein